LSAIIGIIRSGIRSNACSASSSTTVELPLDTRKRLLITWGCCHFPRYFYGSDETSTEPSLERAFFGRATFSFIRYCIHNSILHNTIGFDIHANSSCRYYRIILLTCSRVKSERINPINRIAQHIPIKIGIPTIKTNRVFSRPPPGLRIIVPGPKAHKLGVAVIKPTGKPKRLITGVRVNLSHSSAFFFLQPTGRPI